MAVTTENLRRAHELLDRLPADKLDVAHDLLVALAEAPSFSIDDAPVDTAELTPETRAALDRSHESIARGERIPHEEIQREYGLIE